MLAFSFLEALAQQQRSYPIGPIGTTWENFLSARRKLSEIKLGTHTHMARASHEHL